MTTSAPMIMVVTALMATAVTPIVATAVTAFVAAAVPTAMTALVAAAVTTAMTAFVAAAVTIAMTALVAAAVTTAMTALVAAAVAVVMLMAAIVVVAVIAIMVVPVIVAAILMRVILVVTAAVMARRAEPKVVAKSGHRQQVDGQYAAHHATHHSNIALDCNTVAHRSSVHVSFSAFDTVSTRDGFIDGGMLRRRLYTAAVERSRVNFPEDAGTSCLKDKARLPHGNLDDERRFLTQDVRFLTRDVPFVMEFPFEVNTKAAVLQVGECVRGALSCAASDSGPGRLK